MTALPDTGSTRGARAHARSMAGTVVEAMPRVPASSLDDPPEGVDAASVVWDEVVGRGGYTHRRLAAGTRLALVDLHGDACANLGLWSADEPWERLNVADTVKVQWRAYPGPTMLLLSGSGRALASIESDTSGCHDALCGASTRLQNEERYGDGSPHGPSPCARDLLVLALAKHGLGRRDLGPTISLFKGARVGPDGALQLAPSAGAGARVVLRAEQALIVAVANVPHPLDPRPDYTVTSLRITAWSGQVTGPDEPLWAATPEIERALLNTAEHRDAASGV